MRAHHHLARRIGQLLFDALGRLGFALFKGSLRLLALLYEIANGIFMGALRRLRFRVGRLRLRLRRALRAHDFFARLSCHGFLL